jgi:hypothetical protein
MRRGENGREPVGSLCLVEEEMSWQTDCDGSIVYASKNETVSPILLSLHFFQVLFRRGAFVGANWKQSEDSPLFTG